MLLAENNSARAEISARIEEIAHLKEKLLDASNNEEL